MNNYNGQQLSFSKLNFLHCDLADTLSSCYRRISHHLAAFAAAYVPEVADEQSQRESANWFAEQLSDPHYFLEILIFAADRDPTEIFRDWERCDCCGRIVCTPGHAVHRRIAAATATLNRPDLKLVCDRCIDDADFGPVVELTEVVEEGSRLTVNQIVKPNAVDHHYPIRRVAQ